MNYSRRSILKGLSLSAGASLFAPFVNSLYADDKKAVIPKRFVFIVKSSGIDNQNLIPPGLGKYQKHRDKVLSTDWNKSPLPEIFKPLHNFKDKLTIIQGLSGKNLQGNHTAGYGTLSCVSSETKALTATVDACLGLHHSKGPYPLFGMATNGSLLGQQTPPADSYVYPNISAYKKGQGIAFQASPVKAYNELFGSAVMSRKQLQNDALLKRNTMEFLKDDARRIRNRLKGEDRESFDSYIDTFDSLRVQAQKKAALKDIIAANLPKYDNDKYTATQHMPRMEAQFELGAAALISGLTNVITLRPDTLGAMYSGLGIGTMGLHAIGHGGTSNGFTSEQIRRKIDGYHLSLIAKMAERFSSIREGESSMLDNTLIVYLSCAGSSHHGGQADWPVVMVGGMGKKMKTGRYLGLSSYGNSGHQHLSNLYLSIIEASGMPAPEKFGYIDASLKDLNLNGPIAELMA